MSSRVVIPRLNHASNFNFFYNNSMNKFVISHSFIGNQFLSQTKKCIPFKTIGSQRNLKMAASKVLNCHDDGTPAIHYANNASAAANATHGHIPFAVRPKSQSSDSDCSTTAYKHEMAAKSDTAANATTTSSSAKSQLAAITAPYIKLTKPRLTVLVTLSAICSYALSPYTLSLPELVFLMAGTGLSSAAANAINMAREPNYDRMMARTSGRPVVTGLITSQQAYKFAAVLGSVGVGLLYYGVNPLVAALGFSNIVLYSWIYTSLKRKHIINTWVGALVGAIPPLMGWAASSPLTHAGVWCLAGLLYAWQFPHFNALSHNIADQYKNAGYVMTAAENPRLNARVALRYSILMFPLCIGLAYYGVTDWVFPFDSAVINVWLTYWSYKFWQQQKLNYPQGGSIMNNPIKPLVEGVQLANAYAKKVFWGSVWHLPVVLILAMLHKKGQWDRLFEYIGLKEKRRDQRLIS